MCKPSIVMIGLPNSGTSIMAKLYNVLGWNFEPDHEVQKKYMHLGWVSRPSTICARYADPDAIRKAKAELQQGFEAAATPVIAKQHNLSWCLDVFTKIILTIEPEAVLVLVEKDIALVRRSTQLRLHRDDPNIGWMRRSITAWAHAARHQYDKWPASKRVVRYAIVQEAVSRQDSEAFLCELGVEQYNIDGAAVQEAMDLFDPMRDKDDNPHRGCLGWEYPHVDD